LGEKLSDSENALLGAKIIEDAYHSRYGEYENVDAYKWSNIAAESLLFMAEFIATGGVAAGLEKGAATTILKKGGLKLLQRSNTATKALRAIEKESVVELNSTLLKDYTLNTVAKYGNAAAYKLYQAAGRLGADAAYAAFLANTLGAPKMLEEAFETSAGQVGGRFDISGNPMVERIENSKPFIDAFVRSEARAGIENFSEMMGEWGIGSLGYSLMKKTGLKGMLNKIEMGYKRNLVKDITKAAEDNLKHAPGKLNSIFSKSGLGKYIPRMDQVFNKRVLKAGRYHGFLGEVSEEYYGLVLQHMLGVQDDPNLSLWQDVNKQTRDIFGGIAVSTGILGALGMASSIRSQMKYENTVSNLENLFGKQNAEEIQKALSFAHPSDFYNILDKLYDVYGQGETRSVLDKIKDKFRKNSNLDKKTALAEYADALCRLRGAVYGEEIATKMMDRTTRKLVSDAKKNGYRLANYRSLNVMNNVVSILENDANNVAKEKSTKDVFAEHNDNIAEVVDAVKNGSIQLNEGETIESAI